VAGLLEAAGLLIVQQLGLVTWDNQAYLVSFRILWVAPLLDALIFLCAAGVILLANRLRRSAMGSTANWGLAFYSVLAFLLFFDLLLLSGRIRIAAALVLALGLGVVSARELVRSGPAFCVPGAWDPAGARGAGVGARRWCRGLGPLHGVEPDAKPAGERRWSAQCIADYRRYAAGGSSLCLRLCAQYQPEP
jgi:hypothetical protein